MSEIDDVIKKGWTALADNLAGMIRESRRREGADDAEIEVTPEFYLAARTQPQPILMDGDTLRLADTLRVVEVEHHKGPRTGRWMVLPVGPHPDAPGHRAALWPPLAANHSPNAAARRMADTPPVAPVEPIPDANPPVPPPDPFGPAPGWQPWWYRASMFIARTALDCMARLRSARRDT